MTKKRKQRVALKSHYLFTDVMQKIASGQYDVRKNAVDCAFDYFGWKTDEIIKALKLLQEEHFYESITSNRNSWWVYDVYKARLLGEKVYIHLYIDDTKGRLIINSFKRDKTIHYK
jgi:hypothetical protein